MQLGFFAGGAECLAPIVIADIFFLHERGRMMACYTVFLSMGVSVGIVVDGLIVLGLHWRWSKFFWSSNQTLIAVYWIFIILLGVLLVIVTLTFEESAFFRPQIDEDRVLQEQHHHIGHESKLDTESAPPVNSGASPASSQPIPAYVDPLLTRISPVDACPSRKTFVQRLAPFSGTHTSESLLKMFGRPFIMIFLPAVAFAAWCFAVTIGFLVSIR